MARLGTTPPNFADCLTIGEAAEFLGVSAGTLRNWDRSGKLKSRRHPQNGYRIYLHEDLEAVLRSADLSTLTDESFAPKFNWNQLGDSEHFVQFYENDDYLIDSVSRFVEAALRGGHASIVIATPEHRHALQRKLVACGVDVAKAIEADKYVLLDARQTLSELMVGDSPDRVRFEQIIGSTIARLSDGKHRIHAFGEMVALLWHEGNRDAAIALEQLWNKLAERYAFALFCAYPIAEFNSETCVDGFKGVCSCHTQVIPAESYSAADTVDKRLRAISLLQQKAQSLEAEIEHRKAVERSLSLRERELADFFDNAKEGLHKVGPDGTILWANKAEYGLLGYTESEYVGHSIIEFHADADVIADILQRLRQGETIVNYPARLRCKDGTIKHVQITSNACIEDGEFRYTRCFTRDVTEQWEAEQALLEESRRKDEFLATLSHELRNPLAPVRNALALLDGKPGADLNRETAIPIIKRQVDQLTRLVDDLLDISRVSRDKIELRKQVVDVASVIESAVETSRPTIDAASHELQISLPSKPINLNVDPARMSQVFSNLLNNAAKFTERGGRIEIEARAEGREVVVVVRDNGVGIACEDLAYVFDMFRQADRSLEKSHGGLGIGLTLVRRLVEFHGGTVNAQSEGTGKGSQFMVRLPVAETAAKRSRAKQPKEKPNAPKFRILVVDDNQDAGRTLGMLLQINGHEVRNAQDGLEAVAVAEEFRPDVILMDVGMPKLNGYEATRRIRESSFGKDIFIIALTGWGQAEDIARSIDAGCSAHLVKPVDFVELEQLLAVTKK
jgi:PAS domain S-box-containing protein